MIPFIDLKAQHNSIQDDIESAVSRVLRSGLYVLGPEVEALEHEFADYCDAMHGIGTNSGTSALFVALNACGVGPGDEVITVPFTFLATASTIQQTGASVKFVDVARSSFTMDPTLVEQAVTEHTKAIVPVHLYGQPADMDPILNIAEKYHLTVIEDAAQAHGAKYKNRRTGNLGHISCFSFYPSKNLNAVGEGGIIITNNDEFANNARQLRNWGEIRTAHGILRGGNYRLDAIQAAVLRIKLLHLDDWTRTRRILAKRYDEALSNVVTIPTTMPYAEHAYHTYTVRSLKRDLIRKALIKNDIQTGIYYSLPIHLQQGFSELGYREGDFLEAEQASREVLSLPLYPELSKSNQTVILENVLQIVSKINF